MDIKRIWAVAVKETREIARDKLFAALAFGLPTFLMLLLGFSLSTDVEHVPIAIVDNDNTFASRDFASRFASSRYFHLVAIAYDDRQLDPLLRNNVVRAVIVIPEHFSRECLQDADLRLCRCCWMAHTPVGLTSPKDMSRLSSPA